MKTKVTFELFHKWFDEHRPDNFSRLGLKSLFDYLEEYEDSTGESIEFDPIALCVEYTEYDDLAEFHQNYDKEKYPTIDELYEYTRLISVGQKGFIIQNF
tara:strand:- start:1162 stop:1461 length:300 start_codon:yes stop_codon:yes gene_type:complete